MEETIKDFVVIYLQQCPKPAQGFEIIINTDTPSLIINQINIIMRVSSINNQKGSIFTIIMNQGHLLKLFKQEKKDTMACKKIKTQILKIEKI